MSKEELPMKISVSGMCERCRERPAEGLIENDGNTTPDYIQICRNCLRGNEELITEIRPDGAYFFPIKLSYH